MTTNHSARVYVVDDDPAARDSVAALVESMGVQAECYSSAEDFLAAFDPHQHGCLVSDVRMMSMSGLELQQKLIEMGCPLPIILSTAYADVPLAVTAMSNGAVTVLEKPCRDHELWNAIRTALDRDLYEREASQERRRLAELYATLSPEERQVLEFLVEGAPNKTIATKLDVSVRTIETRRKQIFEKMQVRSLGALVRLAIEGKLAE